ncbi:YheC/YheD family protein [Paenibacillus eucommiae]|uniref:Glutathione synthase/RimK-type ligase-like ATP-grasp enzyme n=1 Tax=Paenibacillus eucommiae TaxID=1355755 RepID=A0ABS4IZ00_9BACL|nr:YheC/YheD family protein [Paenibacillus eucommiae]MBP1991769.1 glutathione synthase/RimK-type ligase-like ATP-grasp enzyme [Paenibacillus eucommiae]
MKRYRSSTFGSKWIKTKWLLQQRDLRRHVPRTALFNKENLISMLSAYSIIYFKPTGGTGGADIIRIKRKNHGYRIQLGTRKNACSSMDHLYKKLSRFARGRSFLLQQGIRLAKTNGRPFDIRVMVQKTNKGRWVSTGMFTKIGIPGKVATNYAQGGKVDYLSPTLSGAGYKKALIQRTESQLKQLGVSVGYNFDQHKKGFRELGLDVALDEKGKPWILEVNTSPQIYPLKNMRDKSLYRHILSYAKQYGRTK